MGHPHVVHEGTVETEDHGPDGSGFERQRLSRQAGASQLGCSLYTLAPGQSSWPYHYHTANEEAIYVLDGTGTLRIDDERVAIRPGDYVALPVGPDGAHRVTNTGEEPLRYLCVSTMVEPDVAWYPDRNMIEIFTGSPPGGEETAESTKRFLRADAEVEYWG